MNNEKSQKLKLADKIKAVSNVLVTVSRNPSADALAAALGLTLLLDKLGKHVTAVFSGTIPPTINFLEPEKTFESNADSLRDFIISLDKEKADRLRYKVEGDLVKVFITPYRTKITADDLKFEQGEFNVELVIAIGVDNRDELDAAIAAHGRIFHDATVATLLLGDAKDNLGSISWQDKEASSFAEMVASLVNDVENKDKPLLDEQIATALLTGVVAATDQFRNDKTTPAVMTLAANLMAKGANQQLIASELAAAGEANVSGSASEPSSTGETNKKDTAGEMMIGHSQTDETSAAKSTADSSSNNTIDVASVANSAGADTNVPQNSGATNGLSAELKTVGENLANQQNQDALAAAQAQLVEAKLNESASQPTPVSTAAQVTSIEPHPENEKSIGNSTFSATLDATTTQAEGDIARETAAVAENHTISNHSTPVDSMPVTTPAPVMQALNDVALGISVPDDSSLAGVTAVSDPAAEAQLDNLVQQSRAGTGTLDELRAAVNDAANDAVPTANTDTALSHGETYVGSGIASPLNAALMNDEPPTVDPFATTTLPTNDRTTVQPLQAPAADFSLPLPPPPAPPIPTVGAMPAMPTVEPSSVVSGASSAPDLSASSSAAAPIQAPPMMIASAPGVAPVAVSDTTLPEVAIDPNDPTQFHIPS